MTKVTDWVPAARLLILAMVENWLKIFDEVAVTLRRKNDVLKNLPANSSGKKLVMAARAENGQDSYRAVNYNAR